MLSDVDPVPPVSGAERILSEYSTRLAARGPRCVVVTRREDASKPEHEVLNGVEIHRHPLCTTNALGMVASVRREGGACLRRLAGQERFDVVNVHQPLAATALLRAGAVRSLPRVYTFLSPWSDEYRIRSAQGANGRAMPLRRAARAILADVRRRVERRAVRSCGRVQVLSEFSAQQLREIHGIPREQVTVIPGGTDTQRFRPNPRRSALRAELGIPHDALVILTIRNLEPRMGVEALVNAMPRIRQQHPDIHLVIGGSGPLAEPLRQQARSLGLWDGDGLPPHPHSEIRNPKSAVSFTGFIPEERMADYYAAADLFVLPTRYLEGFGLVTLEAMACGTPVLGTPVGGTQEILRGFDKSFLFSGTGEADLAEGILRHIPHIRGNEELRARCRTYVEESYSWDVIIPRIEALFYAARDYGPRTTDH